MLYSRGAALALAAVLCAQSVSAICCSGESPKCRPVDEYGEQATFSPMCCDDGTWHCQRNGKGSAGVCSSRGGMDDPCPKPKCCKGEAKKCPPNEESSYGGKVTYTQVCCASGSWECQRHGKGTVGHVCTSAGGKSEACPKPTPKPDPKKCCSGKPKTCPEDYDTGKYGWVRYTSVCCADGKWDCQRDGKGTAGHVCGSRGGSYKACPKPTPTPKPEPTPKPKKCCNGKPKTCPEDYDTGRYGWVRYTSICCADGKWDCQRDGKGTAGHVCGSRGGVFDACPKPEPTPVPEPKCCAGAPVECPANEETRHGLVTYTSVCCADGKWECQRDGKGTAGHVCGARGGTTKACPKPKPEPKCCSGKAKECPEDYDTGRYGWVRYTSVCCATGKWECQRDGKGTAGHVCGSTETSISKACDTKKCCTAKPKKCPADYEGVKYTAVCCGDGKWQCQRDGKGTAGHVCASKKGTSKQCAAPAY